MPIEKLHQESEWTDVPKNQLISKINELIDFINTREQDRSEKKEESLPVCTYGKCECEHCHQLLREYQRIWKKLYPKNAMQPKEEEPELLKCPFCQTKPEIAFLHNSLHRVKCLNCYQNNRTTVECYGDTKQEAISAWNKRA